ncbi:MAG: carbon-nitrogen hydrolase family protein [Candidatus Thermoplasmatota archaeon]
MQVTLAQKKHVLGDKEKNLGIIEETAEDKDTDLLVFPEMFLTGYKLRDKLWYQAENIPGPSSNHISEIAADNDMSIICGMPEKIEKEARLRNTALLATSKGEIHKYRKSYAVNFGPFEEKRYFKGDDDLPVFDTPLGKIGIAICYDLFFPEITKSYSQQNVDIIVGISGSPSVTREYFEKVIPARAIETTSFLLFSNLLGREEDMFFWGGAEVFSPKGRSVGKAKYFEEDTLDVRLNLDELVKARKGRPVISDTRPEVMYRSADSSVKEVEKEEER